MTSVIIVISGLLASHYEWKTNRLSQSGRNTETSFISRLVSSTSKSFPTLKGSRPRQTHLITGTAAGFLPLGVVPPTEDLAILVEVDEIHQQLLTHAADKAMRVPAFPMTRPRSKDHDVPSVYLTTAL